jgi:hypothetical protein
MSVRASYRHGIDWIAFNDDATILDVPQLAGMLTVALLADLFGKDAEQVAADIIRRRFKEAEQ